MHRLFIGLPPPAPTRMMLREVMGGVPAARWQRDDQLHMTVRFVGEVDRRTADDVALALRRLSVGSFDLMIAGVGRFDRNGRTDTLWAGVRPAAPLIALHKKVDRALVDIGLPPETRAFVPHITLARLPRNQGSCAAVDAFLARHGGLSSPPFPIGHLILFESQLTTEGSVYHLVERYPLG